MRVKYRPSHNLPRGVDAAIIEGDCEAIILVRADATGADIAAALDEIVGAEWVPSSWIYVGDCQRPPGLHAVG